MASSIILAKGDRRPTVSATLSDRNGPLNLTGYAVDLTVREKGSRAAVCTISCTVLDQGVPANLGKVTFDPPAVLTAGGKSLEGRYVATKDGLPLSVPNTEWFDIFISE